MTFNRNRYGGEQDVIEVPEEEFVDKVQCRNGYVYLSVPVVCLGSADQHSQFGTVL